MCLIRISHTLPSGEIKQKPYEVLSLDGESRFFWHCTVRNHEKDQILNYAFPKRKLIEKVDGGEFYRDLPEPEFIKKIKSIKKQEKIPF